ncbi:hypothetical protein ACSQ67_019562 [Phaseolus vulgaris]
MGASWCMKRWVSVKGDFDDSATFLNPRGASWCREYAPIFSGGVRCFIHVKATWHAKMEDWKCNVSNYVDYLRFRSKQIVGTQFQCLDPGSRDTELSIWAKVFGDVGGSSGKDSMKRIESKKTNEVQELKDNLLSRYSGYITNLKHEFSRKKKKEKLPKEAKKILLAWWNIHFKWPYPTDADKVALAEWTGLDQKQVNNWFINQRKRHWKPSEEMQVAILDGLYEPLHE